MKTGFSTSMLFSVIDIFYLKKTAIHFIKIVAQEMLVLCTHFLRTIFLHTQTSIIYINDSSTETADI